MFKERLEVNAGVSEEVLELLAQQGEANRRKSQELAEALARRKQQQKDSK